MNIVSFKPRGRQLGMRRSVASHQLSTSFSYVLTSSRPTILMSQYSAQPLVGGFSSCKTCWGPKYARYGWGITCGQATEGSPCLPLLPPPPLSHIEYGRYTFVSGQLPVGAYYACGECKRSKHLPTDICVCEASDTFVSWWHVDPTEAHSSHPTVIKMPRRCPGAVNLFNNHHALTQSSKITVQDSRRTVWPTSRAKLQRWP